MEGPSKKITPKRGWTCKMCTYFVDTSDNVVRVACPICNNLRPTVWICVKCKYKNHSIKDVVNDHTKCTNCDDENEDLKAEVKETEIKVKMRDKITCNWICPSCTLENKPHFTKCKCCGKFNLILLVRYQSRIIIIIMLVIMILILLIL